MSVPLCPHVCVCQPSFTCRLTSGPAGGTHKPSDSGWRPSSNVLYALSSARCHRRRRSASGSPLHDQPTDRERVSRQCVQRGSVARVRSPRGLRVSRCPRQLGSAPAPAVVDPAKLLPWANLAYIVLVALGSFGIYQLTARVKMPRRTEIWPSTRPTPRSRSRQPKLKPPRQTLGRLRPMPRPSRPSWNSRSSRNRGDCPRVTKNVSSPP